MVYSLVPIHKKNMILSTPFVFLQGIKKGLLKHPFLVQIYFSTTLIILFMDYGHPMKAEIKDI